MKRLTKIAAISLIAIIAWAGPASADRASLADNDWNGMSRVDTFAGGQQTGIDPFDIAVFRGLGGVLPLEDGQVIIADTSAHVIKRIHNDQTALYSGIPFLSDEQGLPAGGLLDGPSDKAAYHSPIGLSVDRVGNIYVADSDNHAIRKIAPNGTVTTVAGDGVLGLTDGAAEQARFYYPSDIAVAPDGTIYVADTLNHVIRRIDVDGIVSTLNARSERIVELVPGIIEEAGDYRDGSLSMALFNEPTGLAIDAAGNLYVSDTGNQRIRYIDLAAGVVTTVAGAAVADEQSGAQYASDALYANGGHRDGAASTALFFAPRGIAYTEEGGLLIADSENHVIRYLQDGQVSTVAGKPGMYGFTNGIEQHNTLYRPVDVAVAKDGTMLIADSYNNAIRQAKLYELPQDLAAGAGVQVVYEGERIVSDTPPQVVNDRTMVPVRFISEAAGYEVDYAADEQTITLSNGQLTVTFTLGDTQLTVQEADGTVRELQLDVAPYANQNRTYVPVRFFAEAIGKDVAWIQEDNVVIIRTTTSE